MDDFRPWRYLLLTEESGELRDDVRAALTVIFLDFVSEQLVINRERRAAFCLGLRDPQSPLHAIARLPLFDKNVLRLLLPFADAEPGLSVHDMRRYIYACIGLTHPYSLPSMSVERCVCILDRHRPENVGLSIEEKYLDLKGFLEFYEEACRTRAGGVRDDLRTLGFCYSSTTHAWVRSPDFKLEVDEDWIEKLDAARKAEMYEDLVNALVEMGFKQDRMLLNDVCISTHGNLPTILNVLTNPNYYLADDDKDKDDDNDNDDDHNHDHDHDHDQDKDNDSDEDNDEDNDNL